MVLPQVIREYIRDTMRDNLALIDRWGSAVGTPFNVGTTDNPSATQMFRTISREKGCRFPLPHT